METTNRDLTELSNLSSGGFGTGAIDSDWIDMSGNSKCHAIIDTGAHASEQITVAALQATSAAGAGAKALPNQAGYSKFGGLNFIRWDGAADFLIDWTTAGIAVIEFEIATMDINNGFKFLQIGLTGSTAREQAVVILPMGGRTVF